MNKYKLHKTLTTIDDESNHIVQKPELKSIEEDYQECNLGKSTIVEKLTRLITRRRRESSNKMRKIAHLNQRQIEERLLRITTASGSTNLSHIKHTQLYKLTQEFIKNCHVLVTYIFILIKHPDSWSTVAQSKWTN